VKIAFVINTGWNVYNFRKGLVQSYLKEGNQVLFLTPKDEYVALVEEWGAKWFETPIDATGTNPLKDRAYMKSIKKVLQKESPDVVLSYTIKSNIYSCIAAKSLGIPVICNVSGLGTVFLVTGLKGSFAKRLYRYAFKHASFVFFQNQDDKKLFLSKIKISSDKVGLLPGSGINLHDFAAKAYNPSREFKFLMISRLIIEKGVREFADAAGKFLKDESVSFTLVGKYDELHARSIRRWELDEWMSDGRLTYLSHTNKIKELIEEHDAVVLPSYREGTPRTLLEAAAIGRPLIASNVPGCVEVVEEGYNGFLFEAKNAQSLVEKLETFMDLNREERIKIAHNSRKLVEKKFAEEFVINSYDSVIHRIRRSS